MAKEELFKVRIFGSLIRYFGAFPIKRGASDAAAIKKSVDLLQGGNALLMFPQGTRRKDIKQEDFKRGAAVLAARTGAMIIPVGVSGNYHLFGRTTVSFGKPIAAKEYMQNGDQSEKEGMDAITTLIYTRIKELAQ